MLSDPRGVYRGPGSDLVQPRDRAADHGGHPRLGLAGHLDDLRHVDRDRKSTRLNSSHGYISYAVFCLKKKKAITPIAAALTITDSFGATQPIQRSTTHS